MTILDAANHPGVSWDLIKEIQKHYLTKKYKSPRLKHVIRIAIDEISIGKGHRYLTAVLDLKTGAVTNDQKNEKERLEEALGLNKPLATAYYLKEDLRQV